MITDKKITILILAIILCTSFALGQDSIPPPTGLVQPNDDIKNTFVKEEIKTRQDLKTYIDDKTTQLEIKFKTEAQTMIDDNFRAFDDRMHELATIFLVKFIIAGIAIIVTGMTISMYIWHLIRKTEKTRPKTIEGDEYYRKTSGLITPEFAQKIQKESKTTYDTPPISADSENRQPAPPSVKQIERMINEKKLEKLAHEQEKIKLAREKEAIKLANKQKKLEEKMAKKLARQHKKIEALNQAEAKIQNKINPQ